MRLLASLLTIAAATMLAGCQSAPRSASTSSGSASSTERTSSPAAAGALSDRPVATMVVHGMACPQCSYNVDLQLKKVPGVESVSVNLFTGQVKAYLSPTNPPSREQLAKAIENTTFTLVSLDMPREPLKQ